MSACPLAAKCRGIGAAQRNVAFKGVNITGNVRGLRLGLPALVCAPRLLLQWLLW